MTPSRDVMEPLWAFRLSRVEFVLQGRGRGRLPPRLGSTLRGGMAAALRRLVCSRDGASCGECPEATRCPYGWCFETPVPAGAELMEGQADAPRPVVFEAAERPGGIWEPGEPLRFRMLLVGAATDHLPYLVAAAEEMAGRGLGVARIPFQAVEVIDRPFAGGDRVLWSAASPGRVAGSPGTVEGAELAPEEPVGERIRVRFVTPTRIVEEGRVRARFGFRPFARAVLGRLAALAYFHGRGAPVARVDERLAAAEGVRTERWEVEVERLARYSSRQHRRIGLDGVLGAAVWAGPAVRPLLASLRLGGLVHVGKGTVFGLGRYEVEVLP